MCNMFFVILLAALWESMYKLKYTDKDSDKVYDCRLRPWYVSAGGAPRDVLILLDASGSMENSSNQVIAEQFTLALLSALTDDDRVNVLRFNVIIESPISCFNEKLVSVSLSESVIFTTYLDNFDLQWIDNPNILFVVNKLSLYQPLFDKIPDCNVMLFILQANHVNTAAMMAAMNNYKMTNETLMADVLEAATRLLQRQRSTPDRPRACQQAIVLLTDSLYDNYTHLMKHLDPGGNIRYLF